MATSRTMERDGLTISEVDFYPAEGFPLSLGYMVGPDDGRSTLYISPEAAIAAYRGKSVAVPPQDDSQ